jgi:hypothetical protein
LTRTLDRRNQSPKAKAKHLPETSSKNLQRQRFVDTGGENKREAKPLKRAEKRKWVKEN